MLLLVANDDDVAEKPRAVSLIKHSGTEAARTMEQLNFIISFLLSFFVSFTSLN